MSNLDQLLSAIRLQDFPHKSELPDSPDAWQCTLMTDPNIGNEAIDASQLLSIYKGRYEHLSKNTSAHAQTLAKDIEWFCSNLEKKSIRQIALWKVELVYPYHLNIWIDAETQSIIGCLRAVSQLEVSPEEWETLWRA